MNFRLLYEILSTSEHFNKGLEIEVLKGLNKPKNFIEKLYWKIRMKNYKRDK